MMCRNLASAFESAIFCILDGTQVLNMEILLPPIAVARLEHACSLNCLWWASR
jgi:hypothetical protein